MNKPVLSCLLVAVAVGVLTLLPVSSRAQLPNTLYVGEAGGNTVDAVNATTGGAGASLVTGLNHPAGVAVVGNTLYVANNASGTVGEYNATTGAAINAAFISLPSASLALPEGLAVAGGNLYVVSGGNATIGEYNAATGAAINASLVSGLVNPFGLAASGNNLYLTTQFTGQSTGTVSVFNASTGSAVGNGTLVTTASGLQGLAISGGNLFLVNNSANTIGEYNVATGAVINAALVTGLSGPAGLAISGNNLYVADNNSGTIGEYNATTGAAVTGFVPPLGLNGPTFLAFPTVPEPSTWALLGMSGTGLLGLALRSRHRSAQLV